MSKYFDGEVLDGYEKCKYFIQDGMISRFDFMDNQEFLPLQTVCALLNDNEDKYDRLAKKFVIVSKALELACKWINDIQEMDSDCPIYADCFRVEKDCDNWDCKNCDCSKFSIVHFTTKAKEMIESE